jgi:molecular chaperone DnaK
VREAESHADEDRQRRELIDARNQLDGLIYQTEKTLGDSKDAVDDETRTQVETALADAKKALEADDVAAVRTAVDTLARASHKLAEVMYAKASQQPAGDEGDAGANGGPSKPASDDDDVVEAEFEEVKE